MGEPYQNDQGNPQEGQQQEQFQGGVNPNWNEVLNVVPKDFHNQLMPVFQKWDQNHQQGLQKVHSQYADYKEFVDGKVPADHIRQALGITRALEENPQAVYEALAQQFGPNQANNIMQQQGQGGGGEQGFPGNEQQIPEGMSPEFYQQYQQMAQQVQTMQEIMLQQHSAQTQEQEDKELDNLYQRMGTENPMFAQLNKDGAAEPYMNALFQAGYDEKQAMQAFSGFIDSVATYVRRPQAPQIMGAGGFMPEQRQRPRDMSEAQTKDMMVQMLRAAHHQD